MFKKNSFDISCLHELVMRHNSHTNLISTNINSKTRRWKNKIETDKQVYNRNIILFVINYHIQQYKQTTPQILI